MAAINISYTAEISAMTQPIRILEVLEATVGGTRRHLISILQRIDQINFHVEVASPKVRHGNVTDTSFYDDVRALNIPWHHVEMSREINLWADLKGFIQLTQVIKAGQYDIVHLHSSKAGFLGRLAAKINGVKTIYTPNGFYFLESKKNVKRAFYLILERVAGKLTDCLIAVSDSEREIAIKHRIINEHALALIPNAIDNNVFLPDSDARQRIRTELNISASTFVIGTVSRYTAQKDPFALVKSAALLLQEFPEARFIWCGEGELRNETEALARQLGVHASFYFLGFRSDVQAVMNAFDVFVLASVFEGLPYTLLEVMALGIPVVATNVVGNRDVVVDKITGLLVQPRSPQHLMEAIVQLLENPAMRQTMGKQSQIVIQNIYDVKSMIRSLERVYCSLAVGND